MYLFQLSLFPPRRISEVINGSSNRQSSTKALDRVVESNWSSFGCVFRSIVSATGPIFGNFCLNRAFKLKAQLSAHLNFGAIHFSLLFLADDKHAFTNEPVVSYNSLIGMLLLLEPKRRSNYSKIVLYLDV